MVYFLRKDGTVASAPWERAFFTAYRGTPPHNTVWGLECLILAEDGMTVKDVFFFNYQESIQGILNFWEYLRRYMEEGPEQVADKVSYYIPISADGENPLYGFCRMLLNFNGSVAMQILASPLLLVFAAGRVISMITGTLPKWPQEIEDACAVDPDDPWARDSRNNKPYLPGIFKALRKDENFGKNENPEG
jgi:hypothetical protein